MKNLGERLIEAGLITAEALEKALQQQRLTGHNLGDCLVEIGLIQETALLRFLAAELNTRFVSREKLAQVKIAPQALDKVPVRMAERHLVLPIAWDPERKALSVVMLEPHNEVLVKEVSGAADAEEVHAFIALRGPIHAAIRKNYYGDPNAFSTPEAGGLPPRGDGPAATISGSGLARSHTPAIHRRDRPIHYATPLLETLGAARGFTDHDYAETLKILVGLLEGSRQELRSHSVLLARHASALARRLGFPPRDVSRLTIAAYLHDVGKPPEPHFTLHGNDSQPMWKHAAGKWVQAPIRLFEAVHLPPSVNQILAQLYEAWDGSGVPQGARGDEIAPGARVLAAADAFLDLRRTCSKQEALARLRACSGRLYDPHVIAELELLHSGEVLRQRLEREGRTVLVAEPDAGIRTALVDALIQVGLVAQGVTSLDGVAEALVSGEADVLVVGFRFGAPDLVALLQHVRTRPECAGAPVALLGEPRDPATREQLLLHDLQAILPLPLDARAATQTVVDLHTNRIAHGGPAQVVIGSFDELPAHEVLSALARKRMSGRLGVQSNNSETWIQVESGRVVYASAHARPPEEVVREVAWAPAGDFSFDANAVLMEMPNLNLALDDVLRRISPPGA